MLEDRIASSDSELRLLATKQADTAILFQEERSEITRPLPLKPQVPQKEKD